MQPVIFFHLTLISKSGDLSEQSIKAKTNGCFHDLIIKLSVIITKLFLVLSLKRHKQCFRVQLDSSNVLSCPKNNQRSRDIHLSVMSDKKQNKTKQKA